MWLSHSSEGNVDLEPGSSVSMSLTQSTSVAATASTWFRRPRLYIGLVSLLGITLLSLNFDRPFRTARIGFLGTTVTVKGNHEPTLGAVVSLDRECDLIGTSILQSGGNAVDAILATEFCLGVVGLYMTGLGGGGFAMVRSPNGTFEAIDFRETAPAAAFQNMYHNDTGAARIGGSSCAVPGNVRGYQYLFDNYATLPWANLIAPAARMARRGFVINSDLQWMLDHAKVSAKWDFLVEDPAWAVDFAPNGTLLTEGDILRRPRYADLLDTIARDGPDAFYSGPIAEATIDAIRKTNGILTLPDLEAYAPVVREHINITYSGFTVMAMGAPSSGAAVLSALKALEGYHQPTNAISTNLSTHRVIEAMRFAYGARTLLADASYFENITIYEQHLISEEVASNTRHKILDDTTLPPSAYKPDMFKAAENHGTSHVSAADHSGLTVSLTSTLGSWFGSCVIVPETGLILNSEMSDFSIPDVADSYGFVPSPMNYIVAGKRPMSSMSPVIVEHTATGALYASLGAIGGHRIISAMIQTLWHMLEENSTITKVVTEPRLHDQLLPNVLELTYDFDNTTAASLREKGHNVTWLTMPCQVFGLTLHSNGAFEAASDPSLDFGGGVAV